MSAINAASSEPIPNGLQLTLPEDPAKSELAALHPAALDKELRLNTRTDFTRFSREMKLPQPVHGAHS